ncbi:MAG TPA: hypothetical protein VIC30_12960 [Orrella sp.]
MYKNMLLRVDLSDPTTSGKALAAAIHLATPESTLHVVLVLPSFGSLQVAGYFATDFEKRALKRLGHDLSAWIDAEV